VPTDEGQAEHARLVRALHEIRVAQLRKNWKMVKPKLISDSDVRMIDISVRSALIRAER
jgi:hypothetical protein